MNINLSSKDLSYVSDMFNWNENVINTINLLQNQVTNQELINIMNNMLDIHKNNCLNIKELINER